MYYPSHGEPGFVMIPQINISTEFHKLEYLVDTLRCDRDRDRDKDRDRERDKRDRFKQNKIE